MAEIATHPYTKWQKSIPIPIPELKNCDPSERHLRTRDFLEVNPPGMFYVSHISLDRMVPEPVMVYVYFLKNYKAIVYKPVHFIGHVTCLTHLLKGPSPK